MVRLQTSVHGSSDSSGGAHPLVEHLLSNTATGNKRSRTSGNSLNYKVTGPGRRSSGYIDSNVDNIVIPPKGLPYEKPRQQQQQQQQQRKDNDRPKVVTRARGSGGIPPKKSKLELLSELQGMSEEQIMQALYADPELAEVASEQIARAQQKKLKANDPGQNQKPNSSSGNNNKQKTYKRGITDRVDAATKERGIPYEQWAVLLFLTGIGLYQLYKTISGNTPSPSSDRAGHKNNVKKDQSASNKKAKGKKTPKIKSTEKTDDVDKVVAEIEGTKTVAAPASKATSAVKKTASKNKKKSSPSIKENTNKEKATNTVAKSNIIDDSNGESSAQSKVVVPPVHATRGVISADDYTTDDELPLDDEWKTVSKSKINPKTVNVVQETKSALPSKKQPKEEVAPKEKKNNHVQSVVETARAITKDAQGDQASEKEDSLIQNVSTPQQNETETATNENPTTGPSTEQSTEAAVASPENKKLKKKKKKIAGTANKAETNGKSNHSDDTVVADAALALHLQQEEERLALTIQNQIEGSLFIAFTEDKADDNGDANAWEEVPTKKKK